MVAGVGRGGRQRKTNKVFEIAQLQVPPKARPIKAERLMEPARPQTVAADAANRATNDAAATLAIAAATGEIVFSFLFQKMPRSGNGWFNQAGDIAVVCPLQENRWI